MPSDTMRQRYESLFDTLHVGVVYRAGDGRILALNPAAERILGRTSADLVGQALTSIEQGVIREDGTPFPTEEQPSTLALRTGVAQRDVVVGMPDPRAPGTYRWLSVTAAPLFAPGASRPSEVYSILHDVTEAKRKEVALRALEAEVAAIVDNLADGIVFSSPSGQLYGWNRAALHMLGFASEKECRRWDRELPTLFEVSTLDGVVLDHNNWPISRILRGEAVRDVELRVRRLDRHWRRVFVYAGALARDAQGAPLMAIVRITDVTERTLGRERLAHALDAANGGTWEWSVEAGSVVCSERAWQLAGLESIDGPVPYATWLETLLPEDRAGTDLALQAAAETGGELHAEYRVRTADGTVRWLMCRGQPARDEAGKVLSFAGILLDVTDRKRAEDLRRTLARANALEESEAKFRALIEKGTDLIVVLDEARRVRFWSPSATAALGWREEEMLGRDLDDLRNPDDEPSVGAALTRATAGAFAGTQRFRHRSGAFRLLDWSVSDLLHDPAVRGFVVTARDVTERARAEEDLQRAQRLESLGVLAGGIAHDFNNLLTTLFGRVELARASVQPDSPAGEDLAVAAGALAQGRELTQQLLTFARGGEPVRTTCHLDKLVKDAVLLCIGASSSVRCDVKVAPDLALVEADEGQLRQVLNNLLINARQAMPEGGVATVTVANRSSDDGKPEVEIQIVDRGVGIPPEILPKIFDPFFTTKVGGSGLGLATSYSIIKRHGGVLAVASTPGVGTTLTVRLPASAATRTTSAIRRAVAVPHRRHVLLMDDDPGVRKTGRAMLERLGCHVEVAADGEEALATYERAFRAGARFDAVVMDLTVPGGKGGVAVIGRLKAVDPTAYAIVCSGYSDDPVLADPTRHGFAAALAKPFRLDELAVALSGADERGAPRDESSAR
jgi:PAS domain S-box-containing protein